MINILESAVKLAEVIVGRFQNTGERRYRSIDEMLAAIFALGDRGWVVGETDNTLAIRDRDGRCPICAVLFVETRGAFDQHLFAWEAGNPRDLDWYMSHHEINYIIKACDTNRAEAATLRAHLITSLKPIAK